MDITYCIWCWRYVIIFDSFCKILNRKHMTFTNIISEINYIQCYMGQGQLINFFLLYWKLSSPWGDSIQKNFSGIMKLKAPSPLTSIAVVNCSRSFGRISYYKIKTFIFISSITFFFFFLETFVFICLKILLSKTTLYEYEVIKNFFSLFSHTMTGRKLIFKDFFILIFWSTHINLTTTV